MIVGSCSFFVSKWKDETMERKCDYPGCNNPPIIECGMIGCMHRVCETHGNGAIEIDADHVIEICWECDRKGWGNNES